MEIKDLVNKIFTEDEIFELLVFEVEENFEKYLGRHFHLDLQLQNNSFVIVTRLTLFNNNDETCIRNRAIVDKAYWIEVTDNGGHVDISLTRPSRSHRFAIVHAQKDTFFQDGSYRSFGNEFEDDTPLTEDEMREGFAELAGCLEEYKKSKNKMAV